jgi:cellulose synthase/poly-beta-1,6-N-acetylglucosamine synthase-like glycosyltransferase
MTHRSTRRSTKAVSAPVDGDVPDAVVAVIRWRLRWGEGESNSVRGVNVMRVRDGLIVEALGYSKGA